MSSRDGLILAGDVGGTKTAISLAVCDGDELRTLRDRTYPSREHASLEEILEHFLKEEKGPAPGRVCIGVAGAVVHGRSRTTNLPWEVSEEGLMRATGATRARLLNDLEAAAFGMLHLPEDDLVTLHAGAGGGVARGNVAVIAAGTGLGEAVLYFDGERHHPMATEGGHADFAPRSDREIELLRFLREKLGGRVSYERVLSGPGLFDVYGFLRETSGAAEPDWLGERIAEGDPSAAVSSAGLAGEDPVCVEALELFASLYGAEAGNMALRCLALGGVFVGGGIAPRILPVLQDGSFAHAFTDKGRFAHLLEGIPVKVSRNLQAPIIGCARYAQRL